MTPAVATTRRELAALLEGARERGRVVLVPTMGALHEGHRTLLRAARATAGAGGAVAVSVFVNPLQFGPGEDLDRYPLTLEADLSACADEGADVVFAPAVAEMYPGGDPRVTVDPGPLGTVLEGAVRPVHFRGVLTVVAKLFGLVRPDAAVFGEKDYQQLVLVRRMVSDLCLGVDVHGVATVRERDGLALSSRNRYLSDEERRSALALSRALLAGAAAAPDGPEAVIASGREVLAGAPPVALDYLVLTDPELGPAPAAGPARLLVAARVGGTRLLDNLAVDLGPPAPVERRSSLRP